MFRHASMNRVYRLVWSESRKAYVAVAEMCRARGKKSQTVGALAIIGTAFSGSLAFAEAPTTVVPAGTGNTRAYIAPNGVPVVDINTANAAGVSHNQYSQYNVDAKGLVLNNGNSSQMARQSQLAGQVMANANLVNQATLILNEVVAPNRSQLSGYTEVLGGKADVVVANPYGITCSGCGFINTDRVTLTTGVPVMSASGSLTGFDVTRGDLLINGSGLNGSSQQILDLVARSIKIDGQINANDLNLTAGANRWNYTSRSVTGALTPTDTTPAYAIDSTVLGGMYANRIKIVATEAGVGVRMLGNAAASADDFSIDASGKIVLQNKLSAERNIHIATTSNAGDALTLTDSNISAKNNLDIAAQNGGAIFNGGVLVANNNFTVTADTLSDAATATALTDNNKRFAGNALQLQTTGAAAVDGVNYGSGAAFNASVGNLDVGASGVTLYSGSTFDLAAANNLALGNAALQSAAAMHLTAQSGNLTTGNGAAQGIKASQGDLTISAAGVNNAGAISADAGALTLRSGGLQNSGALHGNTAVTLSDTSGAASENITNDGAILSDAALTINANTLTNTASAKIQGTGTTAITATSLNNAGVLIASNTFGQTGTINAGSVTNSATGIIQSVDHLTLNILSSIDNANKILAARNLSLRGSNAGTTLNIINRSGATLQAGETLAISGQGGSSNAQLNTQAGNIVGNALDFNLLSLTNSGIIEGKAGASAINVVNTLTNNSGAKLIASGYGGSATISADTLSNSGTLQSGGNLNLNIASALNNSATMLSLGDLVVRGTDSSYSVNNSAGTLEASGLLDIKGQGGGKGVNITNSAIMKGGTLQLTAGTLTVNAGAKVNSVGNMSLALDTLSMPAVNSVIVGGGTSTITLANALTNYGLIYSTNDLTLTAPSISNTGNGAIAAAHNLTASANAGNFSNYATLYAGNLLTLSSTATFHNYYSSVANSISSDGDIVITSYDFENNHDIVAAQNLTINVDHDFKNQITGGDTRVWSNSQYGFYQHDDSWSTDPDWAVSDENRYHYATWYELQSYSGVTPTAALQPQLIATGASGTITIRNFTTGLNLAGVINAHDITIASTDTGATFTNDDYHLQRMDYRHDWHDYCDVGNPDIFHYTIFYDIDDGTTHTPTDYTPAVDAGIYAIGGNGNLHAAGFSLTNKAGVLKSAPTAPTAPMGANSASTVNGATTAQPANAITFGGLNLVLPSSPNGYFVATNDPTSNYLVETNPLYALGSNFVGSNYLEQLYGYNPDKVTKRLGDANYEAYLLRQQLLAQTGKSLLSGYADEAAQMKALMENGADEAKQLGFTWGKAPSAEQLANLKGDMVWMVETTVNGQKVLAPQVFLAQSTKDNIQHGAVIGGGNVDMNLTSLTNTGGTLTATNNLNVTSKGDITNTSGTIKGGDVALKSTEGSIVNQTFAEGSGGSGNYATTIGKTGSIESTGNLSLDANKDISVRGADVKAGGDATLAAGGNVTFDTVENKTTQTTHTSSGSGFNSSETTTKTSTTEQVKSGLSSGGNLTVKSKNDVTFAGTDVKAGGNADIDAGGNVNFLARANTSETTTTSTKSGVGVGGGVAGIEQTSTDDFHSRNVGSSLTVGGDAKLNAGKDLTLEGSKADIKGNADINATNVNILAGKDVDRTTSTTTTTTFGKVDTGSSSSSSGTQSGANASAGDGAASADASAGANAEQSASGGVKLAETTTTTKQTYDQNSVASSLNIGGNANINAKDTVKLVGSNVSAGGDANINAKDVKVLAAQDIHTSSESTSTTSIGLMASTDNKASANASADAKADSNNMDARANANASAEASNNNDVTLMSTSTTTTDSLEINNKGSSIKSGGNMSINASNKLTTQGATVESGGDMNLKAKDIENLAATDVKTTTTSSNTTTVGLYNENKADAKANATAGANGVGATSADASADASAEASAEAGLKFQNTQTNKTEGSTTAVTSSFKSGGNMTRTAENKITDVGTQIEAGGDFTQSANEIESKAAKNTTFSSSSSETNTAKVGAYAEANASASGGVSSSDGSSNEAGANAGVGLHLNYENQKDAASSNSSTAVVSNIKAGGNINSTSKGKTSLEGTNLTSGKDTNIDAGSLDYKAAQNTSSSSSSSSNINADVKGGLNFGSDGEAKVDIAGGYGQQKSSDASTTAVTGAINSGGKLNIKTKDDAHFEGTQLNSGGDANINAGGNVTFDAAKNTQTSSAEGFDVSASISASKSKGGDKEAGLNAQGGYNKSSSDASQAVVGGINSGGKLNVSAGKNATFEGTNIASGGDANISAKDNLAFNAAHDTSSSESLKVDASLSTSGSKGKNEETGGSKSSMKGGLDASADYSKDKSSTAKVGSISSGGNLKLSSGKDTTLEGTQVDAGGAAKIDAGGNVNIKAAKSTSESLSAGGAIGGSVEKNKEADSSGKQTKNETTGSGNLSVDVEGGKSSTATVASIKSGKGTDISAGKNATLEGAQLSSNGDTNISAGGDVNLTAAKSTDIHGGIAGSVSDGGAKLNKAEIGGGVENQAAAIDTAGNLNIKSGGKTTLEGTQANAGGDAKIDAAGGTEKKTVVSGSGELGLNKADAALDVQKTSIQAEGRTLVPMTAGSQFKSSVPIPANLPAGKKIEAATADGKPLPSWLSFDAKTGTFVGTPPADFKGNLNVVVKVPNEQGGVTEIPLRFQGQ